MKASISALLALLLTVPTASVAQTVPVSEPDSAAVSAVTRENPDPSTLDEVVVTARKKSEVLQDVPMSVSAFDGEALKDQGIHNLKDLAAAVPGLQQGDLAINSRLSLRGVNSGDNNAFEQAVGVYVDGVYRGRMNQQHIGLFDLERIEVLKGPQVALYGNSSIGGAISAVTRKPSFENGGEVRVGYEAEYQTSTIDGGFDLPLGDQLALRLAGTWHDQNRGLSPNDATGESEPTVQDEAFRIAALWLPNDLLTVSLRHEQGRHDRDGHIFDVFKHVDGQGNPFPGSLFTGVNDGRLNLRNGDPFKYQDAFLRTDMDESLLELQYAGEVLTLTSITAHSQYDFRLSEDVDLSPATRINQHVLRSHVAVNQMVLVHRAHGLRQPDGEGQLVGKVQQAALDQLGEIGRGKFLEDQHQTAVNFLQVQGADHERRRDGLKHRVLMAPTRQEFGRRARVVEVFQHHALACGGGGRGHYRLADGVDHLVDLEILQLHRVLPLLPT